MNCGQRVAYCMLVILLAVEYGPALAQSGSYPGKPIRLVVPYPPGGGVDIVSRHIANQLPTGLGQQVIVDNRGGAGGTIGAEFVQRSSPDGYTLVMISTSHAVNASLYTLPYDPVNDISPISLVGTTAFVVAVYPSLPIRTVKELIDYARANPGKLNYGSTGQGAITHLATELFKLMANVNLTHVPYKGAGPALTDLMGGQIQLMLGSTLSTLPMAKTGKLRGIAITSAARFPAAPDLPTVAESGVPGYEAALWYAMWGPPKIPAPIISRLNDEIRHILADAAIKDRFAHEGMDAVSSSPEAFRTYLKSEIQKWDKVVKAANVRLE